MQKEMKKIGAFLCVWCVSVLLANAQQKVGEQPQQKLGEQALNDLKQNTKLGGYIIGQASLTDRDDKKAKSDMSLRMVRLYADGKVLDFQYKLQMQVNGVGKDTKENGPRIVDAWVEWQKYDFLRVKFGQMKRAFTFENPMHPWDIGAGAYSQLSTKLAGFSDRVGEHSSNGRDFGLQLQGDFLPVGETKRQLFHYQLGVFNGQGINHSDQNSHKDVMGGLFVRPVKGLQLAAFGWKGDYVANGLCVDRNRWAVGAKYDGAVNVRAEYAHSHGRKIGTDADGAPAIVGGNRADAWYAIVGVPVTQQLKLWGKYDVYRDTGDWDSTRSLYCLTADYYFTKNLKIQANYSYCHDRQMKTTGGDGDFNSFDLQLYVRF